MLHDFDIVILGGGPAGTAAGLTLLKRADVKVAIVEQSNYSTPRIGESLTPGIRPLLEYLDLWSVFQGTQSLDAYGSQACWGSDTVSSLDYLFTLHGAGWSLDRTAFDRSLAEEFRRRGGHLFTHTQYLDSEEGLDSRWSIRLQENNGASRTIKASFLIDASGRRGLLSRQLHTPRVQHDQLVGIGCFVDRDTSRQYEQQLLVEACPYGWWYSSPLPDNRMAVVLMTDADLASQMKASRREVWLKLLAAMPQTTERTRGIQFSDNPRSFLAFSSILEQAGSTNWVAVGDALASHDPLSSSGIPHAISTGVHGARVAANTLYGNGQLLAAYQESAQEDFRQYLRTRWQYYTKETRWSTQPFWQRRTTALQMDPELKIQATADSLAPETVHLSTQQAQELRALCQAGSTAHQIVRQFADLHPELPDERIILGLQEMVMGG